MIYSKQKYPEDLPVSNTQKWALKKGQAKF